MENAVYGILAMLGGLSWVVCKYLINHGPQPFSYDDYNRMLTLPLLLMLAVFTALQRQILVRWGRLGKWAGYIGFAGFILLAVGNILEFWIGLLQSAPNAYAAYKTGNTQMFFGSYWGWGLFCIGFLLFAMASLLAGLAAFRSKLKIAFCLLIAVFGTAGLLSFFIEPLLIPFGAGWFVIGGLCMISNNRNNILNSKPFYLKK